MSDSAEINNQIRDLMASHLIWRVSAAKEIELSARARKYVVKHPSLMRSGPELIFTSQIPGIVECTHERVFRKERRKEERKSAFQGKARLVR